MESNRVIEKGINDSTLHEDRYDDLYIPPIEIMNSIRGPASTFLVLIYSLTAILSFSGNITVICVMIKGKRSSRDLRLLLTNLAVSDILMAVFCIPFTYTQVMLNRWIFNLQFCPIVQFLQHCAVTSSVYTLTAIGIDRFYAVMFPLRISWTRTQTTWIIFIIWILSVVFSIFILVSTKIDEWEWGKDIYYYCTETNSKAFAIAFFLLSFLIPLLILAFSYSFIAVRLYKHDAPGNVDVERDRRQRQTKMKILKMLMMIVAMFAICWLPIYVFNLIILLYPQYATHTSVAAHTRYFTIYFIFHWLAMSNSFVNPLIYSFMCENFRADLKYVFKESCFCKKTSRGGNNGNTSMNKCQGTSTAVTAMTPSPRHSTCNKSPILK